MGKYKVYVYAISKNEEKFVDRWVNSMQEADGIYVLDTGSHDNTVKKLKKHHVTVKSKTITPWRFDEARNQSLEMVPKDADICICTDLDEVFVPGWREELEKAWQKETTRALYNYNWSLDENNKPIVNFYIEKIHTRNDYKWTHPVHEVLSYIGKRQENKIIIPTMTLNHYPDSKKSRSSYLPLLELSVEEDPTDDRNMHYLGREYMYYGKWNQAIDTLIRHLSLEKATWKDERSASMRFIARCYTHLNRIEEARMWLQKAIQEAPYLRDPYVESALLEYQQQNWPKVEEDCLNALKITTHQKTYINEPFSWDHTIYDLLSISTYYQQQYQKSLIYVNKAIEKSPQDKRLLENKKLIESKLKEVEKNS